MWLQRPGFPTPRYETIGTYVGWITSAVVGSLIVRYVVYVVRKKRAKRKG